MTTWQAGTARRAETTQRADTAQQADVADYMQTMVLQLRDMAQAADMDFMCYLLEMAAIEASDVAGGKVPARMPALDPTAPPRTPSPEEIVRRVLFEKG